VTIAHWLRTQLLFIRSKVRINAGKKSYVISSGPGVGLVVVDEAAAVQGVVVGAVGVVVDHGHDGKVDVHPEHVVEGEA